MAHITPICKFAGSKARMLDDYDPFFHGLEGKEYFIDYFGGTGTMSLWVKNLYPNIKIVLNELNPEIFALYDSIKNYFPEFMMHLRAMDSRYTTIMEEGLARNLPREIVARPRGPKGKDATGKRIDTKKSVEYETYYSISREAYYYSLREKYADHPETFSSSAEKSATLYFMLLTNFSGIWQTRSEDGVYYTPFGLGTEVNSRVDEEALGEFHRLLQDAIIMNTDFRSVVQIPPSWGDSVHYFDPPYIESYTDYTGEGFSPQDTENLCQLILSLHGKGETVFFSNKDGEELRKHFNGVLKLKQFNVQYTAGATNTEEGSKAIEVLYHNNVHALANRGVREEEYKELLSLLELDYFSDKFRVDEDGCWLWIGYEQVKRTLETRVDDLKAKPHKVLWMIVNKRIPPPNGSLKRTCTKERCTNPAHRRYNGDITKLKRVTLSGKFDLPTE